MRCVGIVTVQKKKANLFKKLICPAELTEELEAGGNLKIVAAAVYESRFSRIRERGLAAARRLLEKSGAEFILYEGKEPSANECGIEPFRIFDAFDFAYKKAAKGRVLGRIDICDRELKAAKSGTLARILAYAKEICMHTDKICEFEKTAEEIFFEYGIWIECDGDVCGAERRTSLIDADSGLVRLGDFVIDGVCYDCPQIKYNIGLGDIVHNLGGDDCFTIKSWKSGKNIFEIS